MSKSQMVSSQQVSNELVLAVLNGSSESEAVESVSSRLSKFYDDASVIAELVDASMADYRDTMSILAKSFSHAASGVDNIFDSADRGSKVARKVKNIHAFGYTGNLQENEKSLRLMKF